MTNKPGLRTVSTIVTSFILLHVTLSSLAPEMVFLRLSFQTIFYSLCLCGFLYQAIITSKTFFSYFTRTKITLKIPSDVLVPDYAICARYSDLILGDDFVDSPEAVHGFRENNTIKDIFDRSPKPHELIESCIVREPDTYKLLRLHPTQCYELFQVTRFVFKEFICYELHYKNQSHRFRMIQVSRSAHFSKSIYYVSINRTLNLNEVKLLSMAAYYPGDWISYQSLEFSNDCWTKQSNNSHFNYYTTRYQWFTSHFLKSPYDTDCYDYGISSQEMCTMSCVMNRTVTMLGAVPHQFVVERPIELKQIDERNRSMSIILNQPVDYCKSIECKKKDCTLTLIASQTEKDLKVNQDSFSFLLGMIMNPKTEIDSEHSMSFSDFILLMLSLAGSWFGFSIIAINPLRLFHKFPPSRNAKIDSVPQLVDRHHYMHETVSLIETLNSKIHRQSIRLLEMQTANLRNSHEIELLKKNDQVKFDTFRT